MMIINRFFTLKNIFIAALLLPNVVFAEKFELKIRLDDCQPDGIINSWDEKLNHKEFWITQNIVLDKEINTFYLSEKIAECNNIEDIAARTNCKLYHKNLFKSALNCRQHSKIMCHQYGGFC